ncbi:copper resistance protein B [Sphingomonas oligophenolica]|uniref:Copper resistance protein B n=1 Tax=Sphingomonas oligophenolica TaxID=301154 RepID=A0ABU9Y533_9SPHN
MKALLLIGLAPLVLATPAAAQSHQDMPGMAMPEKPTPAVKPKAGQKAATRAAPRSTVRRSPSAARAEPQTRQDMPGMAMPAPAQSPEASRGEAPPAIPPVPAMPGMDMSGPPQDSHAGHAMADMPDMPGDTPKSGTDLPPGNAPAPPIQRNRAADIFFGKQAMDEAQARLLGEHGGMTYHQLLFNLAEYQVRDGHDGYRWDGAFWIGGDINRLTLKSEGEGTFREGVESAEIQALYSRAVGPYFNLQAGVRHDVQPSPTRTYATIGFEGLAPYMFEVGGALFLSDKGDLLGRLEGYYDQRITQRIILQPRVELNLSAQDVPETRTGSGLSTAELGLRLRYEVTRQFAPYVGLSWDRKLGDTARYARLDGHDVAATSFVGGVRFWF